ncbi:MAG: hypothetical protein KJ565_22160 [Gammaproteobacteria bacterium]|jgi:hypothetical protein|uniref:hypothetical protein n=1 Tax=Hydrogenophaga sp. TaxID=1904254 RepID=UPI0025BF75B0|nr:hypothetical protein [Hydrogenophaga sp.]MBU4184409.1 hypothetical protein [Gammaproteobacteria bacterium]MBU4282459.1 hypothetical protein [Gammaproteobacteria bacterium]MBU4505288.1 hypothetical protein [Gammaproteobacteria bacterium]MCG2655728.1 hypothetical protein [Hydrogenophaga sp.]
MTAMQKQRIFVGVVGFSDVERHALNTVFRLSETRELSYAPWVPLVAPGAKPPAMNVEVMLVDGESAEAVLSHAKGLPTGQRLIWVGPGAPAHAWRVLDRPIQWASVLNDLDAVYAARQADSGLLDLDVTRPAPLDLELESSPEPVRRALLVGLNGQERLTLRAGLTAMAVPEIDEVDSTEATMNLMRRHPYCCGVFNLDDPHLDAWSLARYFGQGNPRALIMGISEHAGPLAAWWRRRRVVRDAQRTGIHALLGRPLQTTDLMRGLERLR